MLSEKHCLTHYSLTVPHSFRLSLALVEYGRSGLPIAFSLVLLYINPTFVYVPFVANDNVSGGRNEHRGMLALRLAVSGGICGSGPGGVVH